MSRSPYLSEDLAKVATLVQAGDVRNAKREMRSLMRFVDDDARHLIGRCVATLENFPFAIAEEKLRNAAEHQEDTADRALIIACTPEEDPGLYRPQAQPAAPRYGRGNYQAPRNSHTRTDPSRRKAQRTQRQARQEANATRYHAERAGVAEGQQLKDRDDAARDAQVYGSGLDYDKAAVPTVGRNVRGFACLFCRTERANGDRPEGRTDDGLCVNCRQPWRTGLPETFTRGGMIEARCAWLVAHNPSPRGVLLAEWRQAPTDADRATVAAWVEAYKERHAPCADCMGRLDVKNGQCADCRPKPEKKTTSDEHAPEPEPAESSAELVTLTALDEDQETETGTQAAPVKFAKCAACGAQLDTLGPDDLCDDCYAVQEDEHAA